jgi:histidine triad (HIT) family protein
MSTIFEEIIKGNVPCDKVFESNTIIAFKDIAPKAPVHLLIVTKKVIKSLQEIKEEDLMLLQDVVKVAQKLARQFKVEDNYRLLTNVGQGAGQSVFHLHFHLMGGKILGEMA